MAKIAIDAGHYIGTPGKRCMKKLDANETREWVLNNRIAVRLEEMLKSYDCEVLRVDDSTGKSEVSLSDRCKKANSWGADIYISIHHNAGVNGGKGGGTNVYYYSSKIERLEQAKVLYNAIVAKTGLIGNRASKVANHKYYVLANTNMAAFLIENGFMDSSTDVPIILSAEHTEKTAQGILTFLVSNLSLKEKKALNGANTSAQGKVYKVQVGAYSKKENAETMQKKLKAAGFDAIIV